MYNSLSVSMSRYVSINASVVQSIALSDISLMIDPTGTYTLWKNLMDAQILMDFNVQLFLSAGNGFTKTRFRGLDNLSSLQLLLLKEMVWKVSLGRVIKSTVLFWSLLKDKIGLMLCFSFYVQYKSTEKTKTNTDFMTVTSVNLTTVIYSDNFETACLISDHIYCNNIICHPNTAIWHVLDSNEVPWHIVTRSNISGRGYTSNVY